MALEVCKAQTARLDAALKRLLEHPDKEAVHDVRVACRRLRVALKIANPFLRKKAAVTIRGRLKDLLERLGQARDTEVLAARAWKLLSAEHAVDGQSLPRPAGRDGPLRLLRLLQEHSDAQRRDAVEAIRRMGLTSVPRMIEAMTAGPLASSERARRLLATPLARHARQVLSQRTG
ncbi:MAG: CHAD domain-containing protein, partial [Planctomycetota bacterium]|nr:CHAD domain-containing protein [Planctomycetota bacterium]